MAECDSANPYKEHHDLIRRLATALSAQYGRYGVCADLLAEADAELAQPEPKGPTDEKLTLTYACAQAVLDVYWKNVGMPSALAKELGFTNAPLVAALRSAAGCVPKENWGGENYATGFRDGIAFGCQFLHELAAELEGDQ
jgi:hypothetical protein